MNKAEPNFLEIEQEFNQLGVNTRGWLDASDAQAFVSSVHRMPEDGTCVIIGCYAGAQGILARRVKPNAKIIFCDPLDDLLNGTEMAVHGRHLYDVCIDALTKAGVVDTIEIIRDLSQNVGKTWTRLIDTILIDGDHQEEPAYLDMTLFSPYVVVGGEILIDDMNEESHDVRAAYKRWQLDEKKTGREWDVVRSPAGPDKMWVLRRHL